MPEIDVEETEHEDQEELAPVEVEILDLVTTCKDELKTLEARTALPRGIKELFHALDAISHRLAEEVAYKADIDDLETVIRAQAEQRAQDSATQQAGEVQSSQAALTTLTQVVQLWTAWAPSLVVTGDAGLMQFVSEMGAALEEHTRAVLPLGGFTVDQVDSMIKDTTPFVPVVQSMPAAAGGNGVLGQPVAG